MRRALAWLDTPNAKVAAESAVMRSSIVSATRLLEFSRERIRPDSFTRVATPLAAEATLKAFLSQTLSMLETGERFYQVDP